MPALKWYFQRLSAMSPAEIPFRIFRTMRARVDGFRQWHKASDLDFHTIWHGDLSTFVEKKSKQTFPHCPSRKEVDAWPTEWKEETIREADKLLEHRFNFFRACVQLDSTPGKTGQIGNQKNLCDFVT